jgi:replicative DNA helicase
MAKEVTVDATNEQVIVRAALADATKRRALVHTLSDSEFLLPFHAALWRALRTLTDKGLESSTATVRQLLVAEGAHLDEEYLADLEDGAEVAPNLDWHLETLRWDATRVRVLKEAVPELVKELESPRANVDEAAGAARAVVKALEGGGGRRHIHRPEELSRSYKAKLRERRLKGNFYPSGFEAFDLKMTEGFMPRRTTVVTGLPGSGKSTFIATLVISLAKLGRKVLLCVWEMGSESTLDVMACAMTGIELKRVVQGDIGDEELARLDRATDWINRRVRFMENAFFTRISGGKRTNDRNLDILEGYVAESGCDALVMDLWERCLVDLSPDAVTQALYRQQAMHVEYAMHGFIIQQLRLKDVEKRSDKRPTRESIKGTGAYVEVADLIFGIHRDAQFKAVPDDAIEAICLKQRKGMPNWAVRFNWDGSRCSVSGGIEVPYDPGLESVGELGEVTDVSGIKARPSRSGKQLGRRDA